MLLTRKDCNFARPIKVRHYFLRLVNRLWKMILSKVMEFTPSMVSSIPEKGIPLQDLFYLLGPSDYRPAQLRLEHRYHLDSDGPWLLPRCSHRLVHALSPLLTRINHNGPAVLPGRSTVSHR